ncbi:MAG: hypothetical protein GY867_07670 [bacterium]|nr:hypothetical protein [bacterium]
MPSRDTSEPDAALARYGTEMVLLAKDAADHIRLHSGDGAKGRKPRIGDTQWFSIYQEFIYMFLHMISRQVTSDMNIDRCTDVLNELKDLTIEGSVWTVCDDWPKEMVEKIRVECFDIFYDRMGFYGQCRSVSEGTPDASFENTLLFEFGKRVIELNESSNPAGILVAQTRLMRCMSVLKPKETLSKLLLEE